MSSTHQLAAIMFTDIVGYTALMGESEDRAIKLLDNNRRLQKTEIEKFGGRFLKEMGDGILASFDSASRAVYCAGAIQIAAKEQAINLRIGIHLGDVVFSNGDVFGDGVNIASRIEPLAESGGIAISGPVYGNIRNKEGIHAEFLKEESLKNVDEPVKIYKIMVDHIPDFNTTAPNKKEEKSAKKRSRIFIVFLIGVIAIALGFLVWNLSPTWQNQESESSSISLGSIAVLPFEDLSPEKDQEYLGDGLAEEILNVLTRIDGLKVIGRTSSFSFKGKSDDLVAIGTKLGVTTILEGSVRKSNNKIRVTAQLINAEDGTHFWSDTYDRELEDIFVIQDEIASKIADKFRLTLTLSREESPPTKNIEAYELYLKGNQDYELGLAGTEKALEYLEKATKLDPGFVQAYVRLSYVYWGMAFYGLSDKVQYYEKSKTAVQKAIEIDPTSYSGYRMLSFINFTVDWDWDATMTNFNKAVDLGLPMPDTYYATYQAALYGKLDESVEIMEEALKGDPLSIGKQVELSRAYLYAHQFKNVITLGEKVLKVSPGNTSIMRHMGLAFLYSGKPEKAVEIFEELNKLDPSYAPYGYIGSLIQLNRLKEASDFLNTLPENLDPAKRAICYLQFQELDSAFKYLNTAFLEKNVWMAFVKAEPNFDPIKDDPRYQALVEKMNFPKE